MNSMRGNEDQKFDALMQAYRTACGSPEASANFMPGLWAKIEARQSFTFSFRRMANLFATASVTLSIALLGIYLAVPRTMPTVSQSYVEALAEASTPDAQEFVNPASLEMADRPIR